MNYYKITNSNELPRLSITLIANSEDELADLKLTPSSPGVFSQDVVFTLNFNHGRWLHTISEAGEIVDLTEAEIDAAKVEWESSQEYINSLRDQLREKSIEIDLAERMSESTTNLQAEFDNLKAAYVAATTPPT